MFEPTLHLLLAGGFVCESSAPESYRYLQSEAAHEEVDAYLRRIGRRLARTAGGYAYYVAYLHVSQAERTEIRRLFSEIKHDLRPVVNFLQLVMQALRSEEAPTPGERIDYPSMLKAVTGNAQLADELRNFAALGKDYTAGDASVRSMLDKVFQQMVKGGYLLLLDREREVYAFTGKLDYLLEAIDFLMESEQIAAEPTPGEAEQMRML